MTNLISFVALLGVPVAAYWAAVQYDTSTPLMAGDPRTARTGPGRAARLGALALLPNRPRD